MIINNLINYLSQQIALNTTFKISISETELKLNTLISFHEKCAS